MIRRLLVFLFLMFLIDIQFAPVYAMEGQNKEDALNQYIQDIKGEQTTKGFIVGQLKIVRDSLSVAVEETNNFTPIEDVNNSSQGLVESLNNLSEVLVIFLDFLIKAID